MRRWRAAPSQRVSGMLDPVLLRTFLVIAQGNSFSQASRMLAIRQSTVSDHVRRLEETLGHRLFARDTHSVALTPEGEALIGFARSILDTGERAARHLAGAAATDGGRLRFGLSGALAGPWLTPALRRFAGTQPTAVLALTIAGADALAARYDAGDLDLVIRERWPGDERGETVCRDELAWIGTRRTAGSGAAPLPLVLPPPPSLTRAMAVAALERAGIAWRAGSTCDGLDGLLAAAAAGLGAALLPRRLVPPGTEMLDEMPAAGALDVVALRRGVGAATSDLIALVAAPSA